MHVNNGHINHFNRAMLKKVRNYQKDNCEWQRYLADFEREYNEWRQDMEDSRPLANEDIKMKRIVTNLRGRVTRARTKLLLKASKYQFSCEERTRIN